MARHKGLKARDFALMLCGASALFAAATLIATLAPLVVSIVLSAIGAVIFVATVVGEYVW